MAEKTVRPIRSGDFDAIMQMEEEVFGADGKGVLGPYCVKRTQRACRPIAGRPDRRLTTEG